MRAYIKSDAFKTTVAPDLTSMTPFQCIKRIVWLTAFIIQRKGWYRDNWHRGWSKLHLIVWCMEECVRREHRNDAILEQNGRIRRELKDAINEIETLRDTLSIWLESANKEI